MGATTDLDELERQLRHASFFVQASLEQQGKLTGKLDVYLTSLIQLLLDQGVISAEDLAATVDGHRAERAAAERARFETDGKMPAWPTVMVRQDGPPDAAEAEGSAPEGGAGGAGGPGGPQMAPADRPVEAVEVDCAARMHVCQAVCCSLPFPLSAEEVEAGDVKWDLGHPYVIRQTDEGYCVHNDPSSRGCDVYDKRPGVCRGYSCAEDDRIWLDFDNMVLNEEFLQNRRRPNFRFSPAVSEAVPVTIKPRTAAPSRPAEPQPAGAAGSAGPVRSAGVTGVTGGG
jgi:Fe-S-cluster containining protein